MNFLERRERAERLRAVPLERVLALCGARADSGDRRKWHTAKGVLSVTGVRFMNWRLGVGGGGAIDLVMQLMGLDFKGAVDWLAKQAGECLVAEPVRATTRPALQLPAADPRRLERVKDYLVLERGIALPLLRPLIQAGTLYADGRANAVFVLHDLQGVPVGAELRGTCGRCWRGLAPGSHKDLGFFGVGDRAGPVVLCESAIDALSCWALHPERFCISTAGVRPNPRWLGRLLEQGREVACGFDSDAVGEQMARAMIALHPAVTRLRPKAHDWNDQLRARPSASTGQPRGAPTAERYLERKKRPSKPSLYFNGVNLRSYGAEIETGPACVCTPGAVNDDD